MNAETLARIAAFLDAHHVMSLATCVHDRAHAANLFYVRDGFALLWVSDLGSRHSADIAANGRVAATIAADCFDIDEIRGLQISGRAQVIAGELPRADAQRLLETRYPQIKGLLGACTTLREAYARMAFYRLEPMRMVLIDNSLGFGHKEKIEFVTCSNQADDAKSGARP
jgi:uncharacterized protein